MKSPVSEHSVPAMTVETAEFYAKRIHGYVEGGKSLTDDELDGAWDVFEAIHGLGRWTIDHLAKGRAKGCDIGVFARLQATYLRLCEREIVKLQTQVATEKATSNAAAFENLDRKVGQLVAELAEAKAALAASTASREAAE